MKRPRYKKSAKLVLTATKEKSMSLSESCGSQMAADIGKGHHVVQEMVESLEYQKVCVHWVPHLLTEEQNLQ